MWWITTLSAQRLSATIILLWWDFLWELCNNNASTQISTRLFCFFVFIFPLTAALSPLFSTQLSDSALDFSAPRPEHLLTGREPTVGKWRWRHGNRLTVKCCYDASALMSNTMKYKKFITIMQAALGVAPLNKRELIPPPRKLWKPAR